MIRVEVPKRNTVYEADHADGILERVNDDSLLPDRNLQEFKKNLCRRLSLWMRERIRTDDADVLLHHLEKAGAIRIVGAE